MIRCRRWLPTLLDDCSLVISLFRRFGLGAGPPRPLQDGRKAAAPALPDSRLLVGDRPGPVCDPDARVSGRVRVALAVGESWQDPREGDRGLERAADALVSAGPRAVDDRYRPGCRAVGRAGHRVDREIEQVPDRPDVDLKGALGQDKPVVVSPVGDALVVLAVIGYRSGEDYRSEAASERGVRLVDVDLTSGRRSVGGREPAGDGEDRRADQWAAPRASSCGLSPRPPLVENLVVRRAG